jgi:GNAT superfamily N-acetyltransferase
MTATSNKISIRVAQSPTEGELAGLSEVLIDCVEGGASVSFMLPISRTKADAFWRDVAASVGRGERELLIAEDPTNRIVGTVQIVFATPENQPHRADIAKMLVKRSDRKAGIGACLLRAAEQRALARDKTLLVLDTVTGADGERLYARGGWQRCGVIPNYALWPDGRYCDTTVFYKSLLSLHPQRSG